MNTGRTARELKVGDRASLSRAVTEDDLALFASATGDVNPIHFDQPYAEGTFFKGRIAHGILCAGFISAVIGNRLPGLSTVYVSQNLRFLAPVRLGDTVTAEVEVLEVDVDRNRVRLRTTCGTQGGTLLVDGEAVVMPPKRKPSGEAAMAVAKRAEKTECRLRAASEAFGAAFAVDPEARVGPREEGEWSESLLACHGDLSKAFEFWVRQGARVRREGQEALRQWLELIGQAGRDYLRAWEGGGRRDPA